MKTNLNDLNPKQKEAVLYNEGHLEILAGAGTGKTKTLTSKIAYLISEIGILPYRILALTFTRKAANEMRLRVDNIIGQTEKELAIKTFHSWCFYFLTREAKNLGLGSFSVLDSGDQYVLLKDIIAKIATKDDDVQEAKEKYKITRAEINIFSKYIENRKLDELKGVASKPLKTKTDHLLNDVYLQFGAYLKTNNLLTFQDLLLKTHNFLKTKEDVLKRWAHKYSHILIDEFQDTDDIQYDIIKMISKYSTVTIVGDPDQAIYEWRGANIKIILKFHKDFLNTKQIILEKNYRSTTKILDKGNNLIKRNNERFEKKLLSSKDDGKDVVIKEFRFVTYEAGFVANEIAKMKREGKELRNICILFRSNYISRAFEAKLRENNISYKLRNAVNFFDRQEIKLVLNLLKVIDNPSDFNIQKIINLPPRNIGPKSIERLLNLAEKENFLLNDLIFSEAIESIVRNKSLSSLRNLFQKLNNARELFSEERASWSAITNALLNDLEIYAYLEDSKKFSDEAKDNIFSLFDGFDVYQRDELDGSLNDYLASTSLYLENEDGKEERDSVNLMTVHSAKGLEFDSVFIVAFSQGSFPTSRTLNITDVKYRAQKLEEERRLAYVAITRAKENLWITYSTESSYFTNGSDARPSMFIRESAGKKIVRKSGFSSIIKSKLYN